MAKRRKSAGVPQYMSKAAAWAKRCPPPVEIVLGNPFHFYKVEASVSRLKDPRDGEDGGAILALSHNGNDGARMALRTHNALKLALFIIEQFSTLGGEEMARVHLALKDDIEASAPKVDVHTQVVGPKGLRKD